MNLSDSTVLVTGGNGGIGLGMAEAMAQAGANLVIWGTNPDKNAAAAEQLERAGNRVLTEIVDVSSAEQVKAGIARIQTDFGRLDATFANSGIGGDASSMFDIADDNWRRVMEVNLDGVFYTLREASRVMIESGRGGSLVGVASLAAIEGAARNQHYAATKGAVISMVKAIAVELGRHRIRCNAILPGWIRSDMTLGLQDSEKFNERVISRVPIRRWGEPEDFGGVAVYLASESSRFHTGTTLIIDGGYTIF